jgi:hypothetical protein
MLFNARPRKARLRPYFAVGPDLQLIKLAAAPLKKPSGYFSLGLSNVGILQAAFNFGSVPPLDGDSIFHPGLSSGVPSGLGTEFFCAYFTIGVRCPDSHTISRTEPIA